MSKRQPPYHSLYAPLEESKPCDRAVCGPSEVFVHDLLTGPLPAVYRSCDLLYAELPWRAGFHGYNDRAGVADGRTYPEFMAAVSREVEAFPGPVVLVTGQHAERLLPKPAQQLAVMMPVNRQPAVAYLYRVTVSRGTWDTTAELTGYLASAYRRVGDFCCGYGQSLRAFTAVGGSFVGSDFNPLCVGYVAEHAASWKPGK